SLDVLEAVRTGLQRSVGIEEKCPGAEDQRHENEECRFRFVKTHALLNRKPTAILSHMPPYARLMKQPTRELPESSLAGNRLTVHPEARRRSPAPSPASMPATTDGETTFPAAWHSDVWPS